MFCTTKKMILMQEGVWDFTFLCSTEQYSSAVTSWNVFERQLSHHLINDRYGSTMTLDVKVYIKVQRLKYTKIPL